MIFTLITSLGDGSGGLTNNHPDVSLHNSSFTYMGTLGLNYIYSMSSNTFPFKDSSNVRWLKGDPSTIAPGFIPGGNPVPADIPYEFCYPSIGVVNVPATVGSGGSGGTFNDYEIVTVSKVDDVAGDGTGALVDFVQVFKVDMTTNAVTLISTRTQDFISSYTPLGTVRNPQDIGINARTKVQQQLVTTTWQPTTSVTSFSYLVTDVSNPLLPPTFRDSDGTIVNLNIGESINYDLIDGSVSFDLSQILITANSGTVKVFYTEISA